MAADVGTIHVGQPQIQDREIVFSQRQCLQTRRARRRYVYRPRGFGQGALEQVRDFGLILDD